MSSAHLARTLTGPDSPLRRLEAITDSTSDTLSVADLLDTLLDRIRELLAVDTAAALLLDPTGTFLLATAARGIEAEVHQGVRVPVGQGFAGRVAAQRRPLAIEQIDEDNVVNPILLEKGITSLLGVPLVSGDGLLGVLHVGTMAARAFTEADAALLQLVADRVALRVQSQITQTERAAAARMHRSLSPGRLPSVPGLELAARYVPGGDGLVGGDWYDVFALPSGALCLVMGDVVSHGLDAAIAMSQIRAALRSAALENHDDPAATLAQLDRYVSYFRPAALATVLCAVLDPGQERLRVSLAGHPPPVLAVPGLPAEPVALRPDPPVGTGIEVTRHSTALALPPGAVVSFYTDGLVEHPAQPIDTGMLRLARSVSTGSAEATCVTVMSQLVGNVTPRDDIALLVLRRLPEPVPDTESDRAVG
jgi:phosphoserine phosphatase RsbU/P